MRLTTRHQLVPLLASLLLAMGCTGNEALPTPRDELSASDLDDASAALLLQLHGEALRTAPDVSGSTCIIGADGSPPSARILRLLSGRGLGIRDASRCVSRNGRLVDAISGSPAVVISVRSIELTEPGKATAFGTYVLGGLWCGGGHYRLEFNLGKWVASADGARIVC